jgi:hypothetical protein
MRAQLDLAYPGMSLVKQLYKARHQGPKTSFTVGTTEYTHMPFWTGCADYVRNIEPAMTMAPAVSSVPQSRVRTAHLPPVNVHHPTTESVSAAIHRANWWDTAWMDTKDVFNDVVTYAKRHPSDVLVPAVVLLIVFAFLLTRRIKRAIYGIPGDVDYFGNPTTRRQTPRSSPISFRELEPAHEGAQPEPEEPLLLTDIVHPIEEEGPPPTTQTVHEEPPPAMKIADDGGSAVAPVVHTPDPLSETDPPRPHARPAPSTERLDPDPLGDLDSKEQRPVPERTVPPAMFASTEEDSQVLARAAAMARGEIPQPENKKVIFDSPFTGAGPPFLNEPLSTRR